MGKNEAALQGRNGGVLELRLGGKRVNCLFTLDSTGEDVDAMGTSEDDDEVLPFENQIAGHVTDGKNYGIMRYKTVVLKPIERNARGEREFNFYNRLNSIDGDSAMKELKSYVPKFYGKQVVRIGDASVDCLMLEDLTKGLKELCIMDIKIGRRTWSPQASFDKILKETEKYQESKRELGFCIPGFQVYQLSSGKLKKYGKEFGKYLNKADTINALKTFLNGDAGWNRTLLLQLLVSLWRIQNWARKQTTLSIYASSILLLYDAKRLRNNKDKPLKKPPSAPSLTRQNSLYRPLSLAVLHDKESPKTGFSGQLTAEGPILSAPRLVHDETPTEDRKRNVPTLKRTHSYQNDYDKDLQNIRDNYASMLGNLVADDQNEMWASVRMIDFAHSYFSPRGKIDSNYLEGIENLVKIFEDFLHESEIR